MLLEVAELMRTYGRPWWIAGGWALDLHLGRRTRPHADVDIAVLRRDQAILQRHLAGSRSLYQIIDGAALPWYVGERLELPVHEIHAVSEGQTPLEFLLNEAVDDRWLYRRDPTITLELAELTRTSAEGIPFFAPEVVLLYKTKNPRHKDEADFENVAPTLNDATKQWLATAIDRCHPNHAWCARLEP